MTDIRFTSLSKFDCPRLLICALGYEDRSTFFLKSEERVDFEAILAFDYCSTGLHSYDANRDYVEHCGARRLGDLAELLRVAGELFVETKWNVSVDLTSLDRRKMAEVIKFLFLNRNSISCVDFIYCPSEYSEPQFKLESVSSFGPVLPAFAGDIAETRRKLALLVGVGYEFNRIIGAIEALEPDKVYAFKPIGTDRRFESKIDENNLDFEFLTTNDVLREYDLNFPKQLYLMTRRAVELELSKRSVLILPLGPKIFAGVAILIAMLRHPSVMVWRHSTTSSSRPESTRDAIASGVISRLQFKFSEDFI